MADTVCRLSPTQNYSILNYTAVVKIMKKHDKNSSFAASAEVVQRVNRSRFLNSVSGSLCRFALIIGVTDLLFSPPLLLS